MLDYRQARQQVVDVVRRSAPRPPVENVALLESLGRVLAQPVEADRDYPPFHRSTRDGFAVRSADVASVPATLYCVGEIPAGSQYSGQIAGGECVQIMTGAPVPEGVDAVVMVEHCEHTGDQVVVKRAVGAGENIVPRGSEAARGATLLEAGVRIGYPRISVLGQVGVSQVNVFRRPRVAVLSTGDEVVSVGTAPGPAQIRNSNAFSMAAQVRLSGGEPHILGNAPDDSTELERFIRRGLEDDLLLLTGGVSRGKYDFVEEVLGKLGAEFHFDAVAIRPGRPAVFASCRDRFVFGLPGNPVSTMVTFMLFVAPAIELLSGATMAPLRFLKARLAEPIEQKTQLTFFLPAVLDGEGGDVTARALVWQGSGDVIAVARADCFIVIPPGISRLEVGQWVDVMLGKLGEP